MKLRDCCGPFALAAAIGSAGCEEENGSKIPDVYVNVPTPKVEIKVPDPLVTVNEADAPEVTVEAPETAEQQPPNVDVNVDVPEQDPPAVDVDVDVPEQAPPVIEVNVPPYEPPTIIVEPGEKEVTVVVQEGDDSCIADFQACADIATANIVPCNTIEQQNVIIACDEDSSVCNNEVSDAQEACWEERNRCFEEQNQRPPWVGGEDQLSCSDRCWISYNAEINACFNAPPPDPLEEEEEEEERLECFFGVDERQFLCQNEAHDVGNDCNVETMNQGVVCREACYQEEDNGIDSACNTEACSSCVVECNRVQEEISSDCWTTANIQSQRCFRIAREEENDCWDISIGPKANCDLEAETARDECVNACPPPEEEESNEPEEGVDCNARDCDREFRPQWQQCSTEYNLCIADGYADAAELCTTRARTEVETCRQQRLACQQAQEEEE